MYNFYPLNYTFNIFIYNLLNLRTYLNVTQTFSHSLPKSNQHQLGNYPKFTQWFHATATTHQIRRIFVAKINVEILSRKFNCQRQDNTSIDYKLRANVVAIN